MVPVVSDRGQPPPSVFSQAYDKIYYTLSKQNVPILDLQLRYKGDFKASPQFFATITKEFKEQMFKKCKVKKRTKSANELTLTDKKQRA